MNHFKIIICGLAASQLIVLDVAQEVVIKLKNLLVRLGVCKFKPSTESERVGFPHLWKVVWRYDRPLRAFQIQI